MIAYDTRDWIRFIFRITGSDTLRTLFPAIVGMAVYACLIAFLELKYIAWTEGHHLGKLTLMHSLLGFALSLLLVFRTNTAYDRWWEGRKAWGSLTNTTRNLAIMFHAVLPADDHRNRRFLHHVISLYGTALHRHLLKDSTRLALDLDNHPELSGLDFEKHIPNQVAALLTHRVVRLYREGLIKNEEFLAMKDLLLELTNILGICERIKNTPIPFSYSAFLRKFIFLYSLVLPIGFAYELGYLVVPVVAFVFYVLMSLEVIAEEIEDPFSGDDNDLPTEKMAANIRLHVGEILLEGAELTP